MRPEGLVELRTRDAVCRVARRGARVVSFAYRGEEVLWNAEPAQLEDPDWAHGGMPFCWPWFCEDADGRIHGQTWRDDFTLVARADGPEQAALRFAYALGDGRIDYRVTLTDRLHVEARIFNGGSSTAVYTCGYHPYFRVGERDGVRVCGLDGLAFEDDPSAPHPDKGVWHGGDVVITDIVDRLFTFASRQNVCRLCDPSLGREIELRLEGLAGVGIWNPGPVRNYPGRLPDDGWRHFVCVEPVCRGLSQRVFLPSGETCVLSVDIGVNVGGAAGPASAAAR